MEKIKRQIRLFFGKNGKLLLQIIGIIFLIICIIQALNTYVSSKENENKENLINKQEQAVKKNTNIKKEKEFISKFIEYCMEAKVEEAYAMLATISKKEKYNTVDKFESDFVKKNFKIKKEYEIEKIKDSRYKVILKDDILQTGKVESRNQEEKYFTVVEDAVGNKTLLIE